MKKYSILIIILLVILSCKRDKLTAEKIDFETKYLFNSQIAEKIKADTTGRRLQMYATEYSLKSDFLNAQIIFDSINPPKVKNLNKVQIDSLKSSYTKISAKDYILKQSKDNSIIIVNESHHVPYHRTFTTSLLKELYNNGYRHLGLEALNPFDSLLTERGYPIKKTGHYIKEPEFGNMVRIALELGFNVFGYEDFAAFQKGGEFREIAQAENIKKVMDAYPNDKILVHCGYQHASEGENDFWKKAMARRLSEMTGINPLTIDQTMYAEHSLSELNNSFLQAFKFEQPSILLDKNNDPIPYLYKDERMDIAVFHPKTQLENNRPTWKFQNRKQVNLRISDLEIDYPIMIFAFDLNDDISDATPIDVIEVNIKSDITLALKKGKYQIVLTNGNESLKFEHEVK